MYKMSDERSFISQLVAQLVETLNGMCLFTFIIFFSALNIINCNSVIKCCKTTQRVQWGWYIWEGLITSVAADNTVLMVIISSQLFSSLFFLLKNTLSKF